MVRVQDDGRALPQAQGLPYTPHHITSDHVICHSRQHIGRPKRSQTRGMCLDNHRSGHDGASVDERTHLELIQQPTHLMVGITHCITSERIADESFTKHRSQKKHIYVEIFPWLPSSTSHASTHLRRNRRDGSPATASPPAAHRGRGPPTRNKAAHQTLPYPFPPTIGPRIE